MDVVDLVPSLMRAVAGPGEFATLFPLATEADLSGTLLDAVAECQLDGFFSGFVISTDDETVLPDLTHAESALVVLYAMSRVLTARIANLKNKTRYKAGSVEAETETSATVLVELLKETRDRKKLLLEEARTGSMATAFAMVDLYLAKSLDYSSPDLSYLSIGSYQPGELR